MNKLPCPNYVGIGKFLGLFYSLLKFFKEAQQSPYFYHQKFSSVDQSAIVSWPDYNTNGSWYAWTEAAPSLLLKENRTS